MPRLLLVPLLLVALLLIAIALVPVLVDEKSLIDLAAQTLRDETGAELVITGDTEVSLFPLLGLSLSGIEVTAPDQSEPTLLVETAQIGVRPLPLLVGRIAVDTLRLHGLVARVEPSAQPAEPGGTHTDAASEAGAALALPLALNVRRLLITDARLEEIGATTANTLALVSLQADNLNLEQAPVAITMDLGQTGDQPVEAHLEGILRIDRQTQLITLEGITVDVTGATVQVANGRVDGTIALGPEMTDPRQVDAHAVITIERLQLGAHSVNRLHADVRALDGLVKVTEITGDLHGGRLDASASVDGRTDDATLQTSGTLTHLDIASALAAAESNPVLAGKATLNWQLGGRGQTGRELTESLSGPVTLTTDQAVLIGTSVEHMLCKAVALTNQEQLTAEFPADSHFEILTADVNVANGRATLDPLRAALPGIALTGNGSFNLLDETFAATFKARLSPELEQRDHACRVSKRLVAIDWPVNCTGTLGEDAGKWCKVDTGKIVQDLTLNEGKDKLEDKANKLLNKLFNRDN